MELSLPHITRFSKYPPFSISSGYEWEGPMLPCQSTAIPHHLPNIVNHSSTLAQHSEYSHRCYCYAFTSTPLCCLWRNLPGHGISSCWSPQVTACDLRKWSLKSKHDLRYKRTQESKSCCSSILYLLLTAYNPHVAPETLKLSHFGRDLRGLGRARLTSSQDGMLFPRSEHL